MKGNADECNSGESKGESDKNRVHYSNERQRRPIESSSESDVSDMSLPKDQHHEKTEQRVARVQQKSAKKIRQKTKSKKSTKRRKLNITWEPLYFDDDGTDEN